MLLDGVHLLETLAQAGRLPTEVVVSAHGLTRPEIAGWLAAHPQVPVTQLTDALFNELASTSTPTGLLGIAPAPTPQGLPDRHADSLVLDAVQDPGNVGGIIRSAVAAGFGQIVLGPGCADPWSAKTLRAGQGAQLLAQVHENIELVAFLNTYQGQSWITRLDASQSLFEADLGGQSQARQDAARQAKPDLGGVLVNDRPRAPALAWVFGGEGQGVSAAVAAVVSRGVRIPMPGGTESLNVAAAAAICLFESLRQRRQIG